MFALNPQIIRLFRIMSDDIARAAVGTHTNTEAPLSAPLSQRPHACDDCDSSFAGREALRHHRIRVHHETTPHLCVHCGKYFPYKSELVSHLRVHSGDKPFECDECGASFALSYSLHSHMAVHTSEKAHKCRECGASFRTPKRLRHHGSTRDKSSTRATCAA